MAKSVKEKDNIPFKSPNELGLKSPFFLYPSAASWIPDEVLRDFGLEKEVQYKSFSFVDQDWKRNNICFVGISEGRVVTADKGKNVCISTTAVFKPKGSDKWIQRKVNFPHSFLLDDGLNGPQANPNIFQITKIDDFVELKPQQLMEVYCHAGSNGVASLINALKNPKRYYLNNVDTGASSSSLSSSTAKNKKSPARTVSGTVSGKSNEEAVDDDEGYTSMPDLGNDSDDEKPGREVPLMSPKATSAKRTNDSTKQKIKALKTIVVPKTKGKAKAKAKTKTKNEVLPGGVGEERTEEEEDEADARLRALAAKAEDLFYLKDETTGKRKVVSIPIKYLKQFPERTEDCKHQWLWQCRTRSIFQHRIETLLVEKKDKKAMGAYAPAACVNPNIKTVEKLQDVLERMANGEDVPETDCFYLLGNNHNHRSNVLMLRHIEEEGWDKKYVKEFDTLDCIPMVWPDGVHDGFNYGDSANRIAMIRKIGNMHNLDTQNVTNTLDIEAAWQCIDHCLGFRDPSRGGSKERYSREISKPNSKASGMQTSSLRASLESSFEEAIKARIRRDGGRIKLCYSELRKWMNCFVREDRTGDLGLEELLLLRKFLELHMDLQLNGQQQHLATVLRLRAEGRNAEAESVKREAGNLSIHNKFEKYNGVPIDLRLKALKRILGEPDAQYSEYLQRSQYNLKVFFDEIDDEYFSQNFIDRYEKALCVSHKVEALKENFPNLGSCLYVVKGQKAEGSVGRPRKDKDAIEWGLDMQKMMILLSGPRNKDLPEGERFKIGERWMNESEAYKNFFQGCRKGANEKSCVKPDVMCELIPFVVFNTEVEKQMTTQAKKSSEELGVEGLRERIKNMNVSDCKRHFDHTFKVPIITHFRMTESGAGAGEDKKKRGTMRMFTPIVKEVTVRVIGLYGDINGFKAEEQSTDLIVIKGAVFDPPFGKNTTLDYDTEVYSGDKLGKFFLNEDWKRHLAISRGLPVSLHICCSGEQRDSFKTVLKEIPEVVEVKDSLWIKTHKNGELAVGSQGSVGLSNNFEYGLDVYLGPPGTQLKAEHFPFFKSTTNKTYLQYMNKLRLEAFYCPYATDFEKYKHPGSGAKRKPLNIYEKGVHFNDFMVNRLVQQGDWLLNGFSGSNGLTEMAMLNGVNCIFVELNEWQFEYGVMRLSETKLKFETLKKPFEFDVAFMHVQAGHEELSPEQAIFMVPEWTVFGREPELSDLPWHALNLCEGEHRGVLGRAKKSFKNFEHIRTMYGMHQWFVKAMESFIIGVPKDQTTLDKWLGIDEGDEEDQKKSKKRKRGEEDEGDNEDMGEDEEGGGEGKGTVKNKRLHIEGKSSSIPVPGGGGVSGGADGSNRPNIRPVLSSDKLVIDEPEYSLTEFKTKKLFKDLTFSKSLVLSNVDTNHGFVVDSWVAVKKRGAEGDLEFYDIFVKMGGGWSKVNNIVSFGLLPSIAGNFFRHRHVEKQTRPYFQFFPFKPFAVARITLREEAVKELIDADEGRKLFGDGTWFNKNTRLLILPLERHLENESLMEFDEIKGFLDKKPEFQKYFLSNLPSKASVEMKNDAISKLSTKKTSFKKILYLEAFKEFRQAELNSTVVGAINKAVEGGKAYDWVEIREEANRHSAYVSFLDFEAGSCFRGDFAVVKEYLNMSIVKNHELLESFVKYDDFSDVSPDWLYSTEATKVNPGSLDYLFDDEVNSNRIFYRKLKSINYRELLDIESRDNLVKASDSKSNFSEETMKNWLEIAKKIVENKKQKNLTEHQEKVHLGGGDKDEDLNDEDN